MPDVAGSYFCVVCGEAAAGEMSAECNWCDRRYHLNQRNDVEAKDCGQVWVDGQYLALQFACNNCLASDGVTPRTPKRISVERDRPRRYKRRE